MALASRFPVATIGIKVSSSSGIIDELQTKKAGGRRGFQLMMAHNPPIMI